MITHALLAFAFAASAQTFQAKPAPATQLGPSASVQAGTYGGRDAWRFSAGGQTGHVVAGGKVKTWDAASAGCGAIAPGGRFQLPRPESLLAFIAAGVTTTPAAWVQLEDAAQNAPLRGKDMILLLQAGPDGPVGTVGSLADLLKTFDAVLADPRTPADKRPGIQQARNALGAGLDVYCVDRLDL